MRFISILSACAALSASALAEDDPFQLFEKSGNSEVRSWVRHQNKITRNYARGFQSFHSALQKVEKFSKAFKEEETESEAVFSIKQFLEKYQLNRNYVLSKWKALTVDPNRVLVTLQDPKTSYEVGYEVDLNTRSIVPKGYRLPLGYQKWVEEDQEHLIVFHHDVSHFPENRSWHFNTVLRLKRGESLGQAEVILQTRSQSEYISFVDRRSAPDDQGIHIQILSLETNLPIESFLLHEKRITSVFYPMPSTFHQYRNGYLYYQSLVRFRDYPKSTFFRSPLSQMEKYEPIISLNPNVYFQSFQVKAGEIWLLYRNGLRTVLESIRLQEPLESGYLKDNNRYYFESYPVSLGIHPRAVLQLKEGNAAGPSSVFVQDWGRTTQRYLLNYQTRELEEIDPDEFAYEENLEIFQKMALSKDGTQVPYTLILPKNRLAQKPLPTMLEGYGGFGIGMKPSPIDDMGLMWLENGGALAISNIRGGDEFGADWHEQAKGVGRQKVFDDFIGVAEDLIQSKVTTPDLLGLHGASNGGLLVANVMVQRPELFGAVVSAVPLLDMLRFHKMKKTSAWQDEFGNPDSLADCEHLTRYSPYHQLLKDKKYPSVLWFTASKDKIVHPGHARKMHAKMLSYNLNSYFFEDRVGEHGKYSEFGNALIFSFLWEHLGRASTLH